MLRRSPVHGIDQYPPVSASDRHGEKSLPALPIRWFRGPRGGSMRRLAITFPLRPAWQCRRPTFGDQRRRLGIGRPAALCRFVLPVARSHGRGVGPRLTQLEHVGQFPLHCRPQIALSVGKLDCQSARSQMRPAVRSAHAGQKRLPCIDASAYIRSASTDNRAVPNSKSGNHEPDSQGSPDPDRHRRRQG